MMMPVSKRLSKTAAMSRGAAAKAIDLMQLVKARA
jgi:hypothetical protein